MAKILVVEDDLPMNKILVGALTDDDHEVVSALDGVEALKEFRGGGFELVITDVRLPGIDGVESLGNLKKVDPNVSSIILTGYASPDTPVRAMKMKVDDYLMKPFRLIYFLTAVNRVLDTDGENKKRKALVQSLFHMFGIAASGPELDAVTYHRQEAFRGLYIGARSGFLSRRNASEMYLQLEQLEERYRAVLNIEEPGTQRLKLLEDAYKALLDRLQSLNFGDGEDHSAELPRDQLTALFEAIKESDVGLDDVQYAPLLRHTDDETLESAPSLMSLKEQLWPKLPSFG